VGLSLLPTITDGCSFSEQPCVLNRKKKISVNAKKIGMSFQLFSNLISSAGQTTDVWIYLSTACEHLIEFSW
jgi:hypothetical protein